ncbi:MAG TPA: ATP-binding protein, partial [Terriglobales bacterium]|nr:ATP-binding protein [Terriglobales bacterium]
MTRSARRAPFSLTRDLKRDLVQETAFPLLGFRVFEGAGAWLLVSWLAPHDPLWWSVHAVFILYFLLNTFFALHYRQRRMPTPYLFSDVIVNVTTMILAAGLTGGLASPLVLIGAMKVAGYGLLYSYRVAALATATILLLAGGIVFTSPLIATAPPPALESVSYTFRLVFLTGILVGAVWLFRRVALHEHSMFREMADAATRRSLIAREMESSKAAADRADEAHTETVVLAGVAETLSGFSDARDILNKVVEIARGVLWWDYCLILLWDERSQNYYCSEVSGFDQNRARQLRGLRISPADEPDLEWVRRLGHCAVIAPRTGGRMPSPDAPTLLTAPIYAEGDFYGVLQFARTSGQQNFTTNDLRLADRLVARTASALQRAKHLREQRQADRLAAAGELAAGVAHEVNNALTGIIGQVESVRSSADVKALRGALKSVETQAHRISAIIEELLGFGRPKEPERLPVNLADLARDTLKLMEPEIEQAGVRLDTRFAKDLRPALADRKQIQQVLVNLFKNAIHAMEGKVGERNLRISAKSSRSAVLLEVEDTGSGIPEENLQRIFDPFFSTKKKGTGLGLSVSFTIVRAHGGDLTVSSQANVGTRFCLRLPPASEQIAAAARNVLVVDDEPEVAASLEDMLVHDGLTVQRAATGAEALEIIGREKFDAIFLDVRLPDISGQEVYARL